MKDLYLCCYVFLLAFYPLLWGLAWTLVLVDSTDKFFAMNYESGDA